MITCSRDCNRCKHLNGNMDRSGIVYAYECLKYGDSVFKDKFQDTKEFEEGRTIER